ncbi:hypothetical protein F2P56_034692 [Juglans regia]|uniref:Uncharacterized protein n=1 Tax=Juglans regia TaxID=51240 RepID=A0A833TS62_JUGRE|nr:hypothetical protein F2P56_034692 [Juglans regia]
MVRCRQDRRDQNVPGLPNSIRLGRDFGDAHELVRPERQFSSGEFTRLAGVDAEVPRGKGEESEGGGGVGDRESPEGVPARRRFGRRGDLLDGELQWVGAAECGEWEGGEHQGVGGAGEGRGRVRGRARLGPVQARRNS